MVDQNKDQAANTKATSQKDTAAAVTNPTTQAASSEIPAQTQTAPNVKASAPAVTAPPVQSKPTTIQVQVKQPLHHHQLQQPLNRCLCKQLE